MYGHLRKQIVAHLVERSRGHAKVILYAVPGKEPFYRKFGFLRMKTAMAIFENQQQQLERGYLSETWLQVLTRSGERCATTRHEELACPASASNTVIRRRCNGARSGRRAERVYSDKRSE